MIYSKNTKKQLGFSLIELAIVLFIVTLLLGGLLPTVSSQMEQQHRNETRKQLDEIQQALIGFSLANGRLPCPADGTIPRGQANAGQEAITGTICSNIINAASWGVLPWATLGVSETDAWGRRFTYRVTGDFADSIATSTYGGCVPPSPPSSASFALCSNGNLTVLSAATGGTNIATLIPAVIISHGVNGLGAYTIAGSQIQPIPTPVTTDEGDNTDATHNNFVSHEITSTFDDLVVWISPNILMSRMVSAGKLP